MVERIVLMQTEDGMASLERENGDTIIYPQTSIPPPYVEGDIIKAIVYSDDFIEFLELDIEEMNRRHAKMAAKKEKLRSRAKRSTE